MDIEIMKERIIKNPAMGQLEELCQIGIMAMPDGSHWGGFRYLYNLATQDVYMCLSYYQCHSGMAQKIGVPHFGKDFIFGTITYKKGRIEDYTAYVYNKKMKEINVCLPEVVKNINFKNIKQKAEGMRFEPLPIFRIDSQDFLDEFGE